MKTFGKYFLITILLLLGLCCVGILYLFFFPNSSLFGLTYVHNNVTVDSKAYSLDENTITKVVLKNNNYDVNISKASGNDVVAQAYSNSYGFGLVKNKDLSISTKIENNVLYITVTEPSGALIHSRCYVNVKIPQSDLDLEILNNNATTKFFDTKVKNFIYTANNGKCTLSSGEITNNITAKLNYSTFEILSEFKFHNNVSLALDKGKFNCQTAINDINVTSNDRGVLKADKINNLNFQFESAGGSIELNKANYCLISSSDTNVNIKQLNHANITLTKTGSITIGELSSDLSFLTTKTGNISIDVCKSNLQVKSNSGNINITNASKYVDATNVDGNINITYNKIGEELVPDYNDDDLYRQIKLTLTNGVATIVGAQNIQAEIFGSGKLNLTTDKILKNNNSIKVNRGSVYLVINENALYTLVTESTTRNGNISVNLLGINNIGTGGYTDTEKKETAVNESLYETNSYEYGTNKIDINCTTGAIKVRDSQTVNL